MTSKLDHVLALAAAGFWVFPLKQGAKTPAFKGWQGQATRDRTLITGLWDGCDWNIGVYTGKFGHDEALLVLDVDNKGSKHGDAELLRLELGGHEAPETRFTTTPTGGRHLYFRVPAPVRGGTDKIAPGLDVKSSGGYVVGAGSTINGREYRDGGVSAVVAAPGWLVAKCGTRPSRRAERAADEGIRVDGKRAVDRAIAYLRGDAPLACEGLGGDETTYKVACRLKDFGIASAYEAVLLMSEHWNPRCSPPWSDDELTQKALNAFVYGKEIPGAASPEADFGPGGNQSAGQAGQGLEAQKGAGATQSPHDTLNKEYAFVLSGGGRHILWETTDEEGRASLIHLDMAAFHDKHAATKVQYGKGERPLTEDWMEWPKRRSYDGVVFMPGRPAPPRFYNLWSGFAVEPAAELVRGPALEAFLDHGLNNVCRGDAKLWHWLLGYFAHMVQKPWEKPLTALVFKGAKGVGKNALVERVGHLLGPHFLVADSDRYLLGQFNGHMERLVGMVLDEAAWAGDKKAEGRLKGLITGAKHIIEHKGKGVYTVANLVRVMILGNESWLVPASADERRYAVFELTEGRKQDRKFFHDMRVGMEQGEYAHLLRYLLDYDLTGIDLNAAPATAAMLEQKHHTLEAFESWWVSSLTLGRMDGGDFEEGWPLEVARDRLRGALERYVRERRVKGRLPSIMDFGKRLRAICPGIANGKLGAGNTYKLPGLDDARAAWCSYIGHDVEWGA